MDENQEKMLRDVMAAGFSAYDLQLYLNTHPNDQRAIYLFNLNIQRYQLIRQNYERMYGPLTAAASNGYPWQWINSPWPWEKS